MMKWGLTICIANAVSKKKKDVNTLSGIGDAVSTVRLRRAFIFP